VSPQRSSIPGDKVIPLSTLLARAMRRQCPVCGNGGIYKAWISIEEECPNCGYHFQRESGYFLGALAVNIVASEIIAMIILVAVLVWTDWNWWQVELLVLPIAFGLPFLLIPYARGLWMALDLRVQPKNQR
jgi:uncharacterized protein (DUF983 family)